MSIEDAATVPTPELAKMSKVTDESQTIGEFLEWLTGEKKFVLARYVPDGEREEGDGIYGHQPVAVVAQTEELLAEFFEIDLKKVEAERRALLEAIRS